MSSKNGINIIFPFRSFHNQTFSLNLSLFFILPILFNVLVLVNLAHITDFWGVVLNFFITKLQLNAEILQINYTLFNVNFMIPSIDLYADLPNAEIWWSSIVISILLFIFSFFLSDAFTPLKYFLRVMVSILWIVQLFFLFYPASFPYNIRIYSLNGFMQILSLLFATPWIYAFTYYLFGYDLIKKFLITILVLSYFIVLAPFQYLLNSVIIYHYSLLFMPLLYLFAGLLLNIFSIVAFYAYGMSLIFTAPKFKQ